MKVTLVTCFNANWHHGRVPDPYIPLNLLGLAAGLRGEGHEVVIVDQTLALLQGKAIDGPEFHDQIADLIYADRPDVVGLTTMCNSYPQTLSLARHYRDHDPKAKIILGGPQATVVDVPTLQHYPWIDAVVRNEADYSLNQLIAHWSRGIPPLGVTGVTWRSSDGEIYRNDNAALIEDMDVLPYPAYDLYPLSQVNARLIPIEAGRGCPYGCTFCSTNLYFNRRYRIKTPQRLIEEMKYLHGQYGVQGFDLVHDMMTVDRKWVQSFCDLLIEGQYDFQWGCSARVDRVDEPLLKDMSKAGCVGIFFGVETGSQRLQPIVKKKLIVDHVLPTIRTCIKNQILPTGSMITGFPDETISDMMDSFQLALDILQIAPKTIAQMHMLAPLVGSPLYHQYKDDLRFDGHSSDISLFLLTNAEIEMVQQQPDIFPNFYYIPAPQLDRDLVKAVSASVYTCYELFLALRYAGADIERVLTGWVAWQHTYVDQALIGQDYYLYHFGLDFCRYLRAKVLDQILPTAPHLRDMVDYFNMRYSLQRGHISARSTFRQFDYDVRGLIKQLRSDAPTLLVEPTATDLLFINLAVKAEYGYAYLEVQVPRNQNPVVKPGDELEIRDPVKQLLTRPDIIIRNNTQQRVFATKHHLTQEHLRSMGILRIA